MLAAGAEGLGGAYAGVLMVCGERGRLGVGYTDVCGKRGRGGALTPPPNTPHAYFFWGRKKEVSAVSQATEPPHTA